jgi:DNA polymerase-3 subunit delta
MTAVRPAEVDAVLSRIDPLRPVILLYGPDSGLVRERAQTYLKRALAGSDDPFGLIRLDGDELAGNPVRLIEEASTVALFGGRRVVSLRVGSKNIVPVLEPVLASPPSDAIIVIEAGDLKKGAPLRSLGESSPRVAAIACYADTDRDVARLVDTMVAEAGMSIERDARADLMALLGGDRLASRGEIAKLILYATGDTRITGAHVRAIVGDASNLALDDISDAALAGNGRDAASAFAKAMGEGIRPDAVLGATSRAAQGLHMLRLNVENGGSVERAIESARPAIHFRRRPLVEAALRNWTATRLANAFVTLDEALLAARRNATLAPAIAERALLSLASAARRG